jgi:hypothetical protein
LGTATLSALDWSCTSKHPGFFPEKHREFLAYVLARNRFCSRYSRAIPDFGMSLVQKKIKKVAVGAFALAVVASIAFAATATLSTPGAGSEAGVIEDADTVKHSIAEQFSAAPGEFVLSAASRRLALARLDGFAVCTQVDEAAATQYVEVAAMIDKATLHAPEFRKIVDHVMDSDAGMNDCDYRVISLISRVTTGG